MTDAQRKRLAREARKLAMECVEGTAPLFGECSMSKAPYCALGRLSLRFAPNEPPCYPSDRAEKGDVVRIWDAERLVYFANDYVPADDRHAAVVFPLLALADALEAA